jgi:hypothetical protein
VLLVPGELMGMKSYLRFGFGGDSQTLVKALGRVSEYMRDGERQGATG